MAYQNSPYSYQNKGFAYLHELPKEDTGEYGDASPNIWENLFDTLDESRIAEKVIGGEHKYNRQNEMGLYNKYIAGNARKAYDKYASTIAEEKGEEVRSFEEWAKADSPFIYSAIKGNLEYDEEQGIMFKSRDGEMAPFRGTSWNTEAPVTPFDIFGGDAYAVDTEGKINLSTNNLDKNIDEFSYDYGKGAFPRARGLIKSFFNKGKDEESYLPERGPSPNPATAMKKRKAIQDAKRYKHNYQNSPFFNQFSEGKKYDQYNQDAYDTVKEDATPLKDIGNVLKKGEKKFRGYESNLIAKRDVLKEDAKAELKRLNEARPFHGVKPGKLLEDKLKDFKDKSFETVGKAHGAVNEFIDNFKTKVSNLNREELNPLEDWTANKIIKGKWAVKKKDPKMNTFDAKDVIPISKALFNKRRATPNYIKDNPASMAASGQHLQFFPGNFNQATGAPEGLSKQQWEIVQKNPLNYMTEEEWDKINYFNRGQAPIARGKVNPLH